MAFNCELLVNYSITPIAYKMIKQTIKISQAFAAVFLENMRLTIF